MKLEHKLLILGLISGVLAVVLGNFYFNEKEKSLIKSLEPEKVICAKEYIPAWSKITADKLMYVEIPKKFITKAHVKEYSKIKGKITKVPFIKGEPILLNKLTEKEDELNTAIPTGLRAVSISIDEESSVGYMIKPGDLVDVLLSFEIKENKRIYTVTATILQSVKVIAVGNNFSDNVENSYDTITLALTPEEAEILTFAKEKGRITFSLRPVGEKEKVKIKLVSFKNLINYIKENEKGEEIIKKEINNIILKRRNEE